MRTLSSLMSLVDLKEMFHPPELKIIIKERVHLEIKILPSFTDPLVVPSLYDFLSSMEYKRRKRKKMFTLFCTHYK